MRNALSQASFKIVESLDEYVEAMVVRGIVFCEQQHVSYSLEKDNYDLSALHILGHCADEPVAAGRIVFFKEFAKLERIAVRKAFRSQGIGHRLVDFMVKAAGERGFLVCKMHVQTQLENFYRKHGFKSEGSSFVEAGIDHITMSRKELAAAGSSS